MEQVRTPILIDLTLDDLSGDHCSDTQTETADSNSGTLSFSDFEQFGKPRTPFADQNSGRVIDKDEYIFEVNEVKPVEWGTMIHHNAKRIGVYFVRMGSNGPIKIGYSDDQIKSRIAKGKTFNPARLNILYIVSSDRINHKHLEQVFHSVFWRRRIWQDKWATEWFNITEEDIQTLFYHRQFHSDLHREGYHADNPYASDNSRFINEGKFDKQILIKYWFDKASLEETLRLGLEFLLENALSPFNWLVQNMETEQKEAFNILLKAYPLFRTFNIPEFTTLFRIHSVASILEFLEEGSDLTVIYSCKTSTKAREHSLYSGCILPDSLKPKGYIYPPVYSKPCIHPQRFIC